MLERQRREVEFDEFAEDRLGTIEQAGLHVVLAQCEQRLHALAIGKVVPLHERLVQADRAVDLAAAAEQMAERDLRLEGFLVELRDVQEQLDRLVRLLVEQVVQAAEIGRRQVADLALAMQLAAASTDDPAREGGQREQQEEPKPFGNECHHGLRRYRREVHPARQ